MPTYRFQGLFTSGTDVKTPSDNGSLTLKIVNSAGSLVTTVSSLSCSAAQNGYVVYDYTTASAGDYTGFWHSADSSLTLQTVPSHPILVDASGNVFSAPQTDPAGVTTLLTRIIGTVAAGTHNAQSGDAYARLGAPAGASVSADIAALSTAGDPLTNDVPGSYEAGTAGYILGNLGGYAVTVVSPVAAAGDMTITRGDTWSATLTGLADNDGYDKIWFTVKRKTTDADADALVQILVSDPPDAGDGLQILNGEAAYAADGSITVESATSLTVALSASAAADLAPCNGLVYDVQYLIGSAVQTACAGALAINGDVTRAVS